MTLNFCKTVFRYIAQKWRNSFNDRTYSRPHSCWWMDIILLGPDSQKFL